MADVTVIGAGIFLRGSIRGEGDLEIRGRIEGDIEVAGEVTIADGALVKADVSGRRIVVRGAVAGNLTGEEAVRLEGGARVVGDLKALAIGIAEGALLRGNVQTEKAAPHKPVARGAASRIERPLPARIEPRKVPAATASSGNGATRRGSAAASEERPAPPPPVVPALKKGARAALRKRAR
jgi:cytoskeletal protein CcmA (bactofilin family)